MVTVRPTSSSLFDLFRSLPVQISLFLYILIQSFLLYKSNWSLHFLGGDACMYYENALCFLENRPYTYSERQPFYPLTLSTILWIFGKKSIEMCVIFQFLVHIGVALCSFKIANLIIPKWKNSVFILVLLNPSALFHTEVLITETLYAFLFGLAYYWLLIGAYQKNWISTIGSGFLIGTLALTRPEAKFLLYLTPFLVFYLYMVFHLFKQSWGKLLLISTLTFGAGFLITVPWQLYLSHHTSHTGVTSSQKQFDHISLNVAILENLAQEGKGLLETYPKVLLKGEEAFHNLPESYRMSLPEKHAFLNRYYLKQFFTYPFPIYVRAFLQSWSMIYLANGSQILMELLFQDRSVPKDFQHKPNILKNMLGALKENPVSFLTTSLLFFGTLCLRILNVFGLIALMVNKQYKWLFALCFPVLFVTIINLCDGQSRARLALEPILMIWAVYGFMYLKEILLKIFKRTISS
ncbi:MAG: hypothetical protein B7Y25_07125 [Alphaproteobacteria bacterium 16-39-46]|nr:MAG: hypothetical protein B7Y25_07125 [Alphaproteobacteria bacterium 16-39-46]OZA41864.1 MAG: hypothetical protein B7X84_07255 [Alphaproteobacteria bacterium 17-39-52]